MATTDLERKYFFKKQATDAWQDITKAFLGVKVLGIEGFNELGDTTNVYNEQWYDGNKEDFYIVGDSIVRKNVDLSMNIIVSRRYVPEAIHDFFDEEETYNRLVSELLSKDFYVYSDYTKLQAHVVCTKGFKPTTVDLHRGIKSYILVTIPLHLLDKPCDIKSTCPYYNAQIGSLS